MVDVFASDGARLSAEATGSGPSLLLVHGGSQTRAAWSRVTPQLAVHARVFNLDRRGRGASGDGPEHSLALEADDIARVANAVPKPVHLVAHSFGALCALESLLIADEIASALLYEPPLVEHHPSPSDSGPLREALAAGGHAQLLDTFMRDFAGLPEGAIEASRRDPAWPARVSLAPTLIRETDATFQYRVAPARLREIQTPVTVLIGDQSNGWMINGCRALSSMLQNAELRTLAGQGHVAMITAPELMVDAILRSMRGEQAG
jgi:pimeloyl-ACP methyl ester carboxylesterase